MKETRLRVPDMSCGHCEASVRGALEGLEGVERINVSLDTKRVNILSIEELDAHDFIEAIRSVGFSPEMDG